MTQYLASWLVRMFKFLFFSFILGNILVVSLFAATPKTVQKPQKQKLVLMPLIVSSEDIKLQNVMENALVEGLQEKYTVFSGDAVKKKGRQIFEKENKTAKVKCDETKCMEDIALAFNSELLATASVTKQGNGYFISISIQNIFDNKVIFTKTLPCKDTDSYAIMDKLKELATAKSDQIASAVDKNDPEGALWLEVKASNTVDEYNAFIQAYPNGKYISLANAGLQKIKDAAKAVVDEKESKFWATVQQENSEDSYNRYLKQYPKGKFTPLAEIRIKKIALPAWLTTVPKSKDLFYAIGTVKLTGPNNYNDDINKSRTYKVGNEVKENLSIDELKKLAYDRALDEVAQSVRVDVNSTIVQYKETTGAGADATVDEFSKHDLKIASDGLKDYGKIEQEYTAADGNYFVLISYQKKKIDIDKMRKMLIKQYIYVGGSGEGATVVQYYSAKFQRGDISDSEKSLGAPIVAQDMSKRPFWVDNPELEGKSYVTGYQEFRDGESLFFSLQMAIANARSQLAQNINANIQLNKGTYVPTAILTIKNSEVYNIYIGKSAVYVLMGIKNK